MGYASFQDGGPGSAVLRTGRGWDGREIVTGKLYMIIVLIYPVWILRDGGAWRQGVDAGQPTPSGSGSAALEGVWESGFWSGFCIRIQGLARTGPALGYHVRSSGSPVCGQRRIRDRSPAPSTCIHCVFCHAFF
ncbi:hypothetical protein CS8_043000 [Cupriavidus sp. 8B]